jgi:hypothetical protein
MDDSTRNRVSGALFHLALEHHGAIQLLVSYKPYPHYGSACALLRPQFEAYVRGVWYHRCANEQDIDKFIKGGEPPLINGLISAVEKLPGYEEGKLSATKKDVWKTMCGLTHGGSSQVASRNTATGIAAAYTDEQIQGLLVWACKVTLLVSVDFAKLLNNEKLINDVWLTYMKLFAERLQ